MATTNTLAGRLNFTAEGLVTFTTDHTGQRRATETATITFAATGGTAPTMSGFLGGDLSITGAQDILLAHATDPLQSTGDAAYSDGFTVASTKIKLFYMKNTHASASLTVARGAANGLIIFDAASDSITLGPGGFKMLYHPTGYAALTTGSNDKLTLTPSTGTVTADILVIYGA